MEDLIEVLLIGASVLLMMGLLFSLMAWLVVRRVRRSGIVQRGFQNSVLTARSFATDKSVREPARLRIELRRSTEATRRSLSEAAMRGWPVGELPAAAETLERAANSLDDQLRIAEREPNRALKREWSEDLGKQVRSLDELSAELRRCLLQTCRSAEAAQIQQATTRLNREVNALQAWSNSYGSHQRT